MKRSLAFTLIFTPLALGFLWLFFGWYVRDYFNSIKFDQKVWLNASSSESTWCARWDMRRDLTTNYDLIGKSRQEIESLLGPPETTHFGRTMSYDLGPTRNWIDNGQLDLELEKDTVINYKIWSG